ncbi:MAG: hypothetical protein SVU69_07295 [Pseudomonadota bacterium]|nr:hypothetical protein [Pseudomonadota bacterium]
MSLIHELRESVEARLDRWESLAEALELQLQLGRKEALDRFEDEKQRLTERLEAMEKRFEETTGIADDMRDSVRGQVEHLRVQLALGRAETRDAYQEQRKNILAGIRSLEERLDSAGHQLGQENAERLEAVTKDLIRAADRLVAELEALEYQFEVGATTARQQLDDLRKDVVTRAQSIRKRLREQGSKAEDKMEAFEKDISQAASQAKQAFKKLFS